MRIIVLICTALGCHERVVPVYTDNPMACVLGAQAELAQLLRPGERVERWRCEP
jgi:hypothetical protein